MIKDIECPLPDISYYLGKVKKYRRKHRYITKQLSNYGINYVDLRRCPALVEEYAKRCGLTKEQARTEIKVIFAELKKLMLQDFAIKITLLGTFYTKHYRNAFKVGKGRVPAFMAARRLRDHLIALEVERSKK